jgi:cell division protein FtsQ
MAQVAQIDITPERNFEMVPVVGNHLVKLGNGENIDKKFHRLMVFYKQVLSKTGFDKYKVIDVQYKGQVVASKYSGNAKVDSVQLKRNVEKLLRQSIEAERDTVVKAMPPIVKLETDEATATDPTLQDAKNINPEKRNSPNPLKPSLPEPADKKVEKPKTAKTDKAKTTKVAETKKEEKKKEPKAVMPKKPVEDENGGYN